MTRAFASAYRDPKRAIPDPFAVEKLKRVDRPTTRIEDGQVPRVDERDGGFYRAGQGEFGPTVEREYGRFMDKYALSASLLHMSKMLGQEDMVDGDVREGMAPGLDNPIANARHIKELAYFLRSDAVGICELPPYAVFTHSRIDGSPIELKHKYAIAILVDQDWKTSAAFDGRDWISNSMSFLAYSNSGFIACVIADYLRRLGVPARAHHAKNYQVLVPPILVWAGLGEMSRMGDVVINPFLGPRFKAAIITTDLPLAIDKPIDFGLQDFCSKCKKCARECPSGAISDGDKIFSNGYEKWQVDVEKCTSFRCSNQYGSGCGTCIKVCPWNKPDTRFHQAINWSMRNIPFSRNFAV
ncbi:MAG: reductive dehalogenase, partial [Holophaga sp.]|nr:reductive dehalogenase [Holophaga sp.]